MSETFGTAETRLIIVRGNSGSGKSTLARAVREALADHPVAVIGQDQIRRELLKVKDTPGNASVALIDAIVRHTVDHGFHAVVEGIFHAPTYGTMLTGLVADHRGRTSCWFYDLPWEETLRRHADKRVTEYGETELRQWWNGRQLIPGLGERLIPAESSLARTVAAVVADTGLDGADPREARPARWEDGADGAPPTAAN